MITNMSQADKEMAELFRQAWEVATAGGAWEEKSEWAAYNPAATSNTSFATVNARIVLDKSLFTPANKIRLSFDGPVDGAPTQGLGFMAVVGFRAAAGNPWDFASAPIPVLFSASPTLNMNGVLTGNNAIRYVSDEIDLVIDGTKDIIVSMTHASGVVGTSSGTVAEPPLTWHMYLDAASGNISALTPAGLIDVRAAFGDNHQWALSRVETRTLTAGYKIDWPNAKTVDHEEDEIWARWALDYVGGRQNTFAAPGQRKFSKMGLVIITVFTPLGGGLASARDAAQIALFAYEGKRTPGDVWFRNVRIDSEGHGQGTGKNKSWWTQQVIAEFHYEHLR